MKSRLLLVDDEPPIRAGLRRILERAYQLEVMEAASNDQAFQILERWRPDLIISDLRRPGGTGFEFVEQVRAAASTESIPIVVLSGSLGPDDRARLDVEGCFSKPFEARVLLHKVARLLHLHGDPDASLVMLGYEFASLDYKETIEIGTRLGRASLAKDVIAMSNSGGGTIVVGVAERSPGVFEPAGLSDAESDLFEPTQLNDKIRPFVGARLSVVVRHLIVHERRFVILRIPAAVGTLALPGKECAEVALFQGRVYSRTQDARSAEVQDSTLRATLLEDAHSRAAARGPQ